MRQSLIGCLFLTLALAANAGQAAAQPVCRLEKIGELPVIIGPRGPQVSAQIDGQPATLLVATGDELSSMAQDTALRLGLKLKSAPVGLRINAGGHYDAPRMVTVRSVIVGSVNFAKFDFLTTTVPDFASGLTGVLGQNFWNEAETEFDLGQGVVRLFQPSGSCGVAARVYWTKTFSSIALDHFTGLANRPEGQVKVNGQPMHVLFSSIGVSAISRESAARIGVTPETPGVTAVDQPPSETPGSRAWSIPIDRLQVGDEDLPQTRLRMVEGGGGEVDMVLGADFFLSHRIYISKDQERMYFTPNRPVTGAAASLCASPPGASGRRPVIILLASQLAITTAKLQPCGETCSGSRRSRSPSSSPRELRRPRRASSSNTPTCPLPWWGVVRPSWPRSTAMRRGC